MKQSLNPNKETWGIKIVRRELDKETDAFGYVCTEYHMEDSMMEALQVAFNFWRDEQGYLINDRYIEVNRSAEDLESYAEEFILGRWKVSDVPGKNGEITYGLVEKTRNLIKDVPTEASFIIKNSEWSRMQVMVDYENGLLAELPEDEPTGMVRIDGDKAIISAPTEYCNRELQAYLEMACGLHRWNGIKTIEMVPEN